MPERKTTMSDREEMQIPTQALCLVSPEASGFSVSEPTDSSEGKTRKAKFRMVANSGDVIENHPYWGNFAIDLDGLKIGRKRKPALRDHDSQRIVGWTHSLEIGEEGLVAEGTFTESTPDGREVLDMLRDGFPWQASVFVPPRVIEKVGPNETVRVNGRTLTGPGHVFRESSLREVTFTALGADENTDAAQLSSDTMKIKASVFSVSPIKEEVPLDQQETKMQEEEAVVDTSKLDAPVSDEAETSLDTNSIDEYEKGVTSERDRISSILSHSLDHQRALSLDLISNGTEKAEAFSALLKDAQGQVDAKLAHLSQTTLDPVGPDEPGDQETDLQAAFSADPKLAEEFGTFEIWEAYTNAMSEGVIRPGKGDN